MERRHWNILAPPARKLGGYTVGVLVQTNFGGILTVNGAPVGQELGQYYLKNEVTNQKPSTRLHQPSASGATLAKGDGSMVNGSPDGSCMIIVATDAPMDARNLRRLAARALMGLARTGSSGSNGS